MFPLLEPKQNVWHVTGFIFLWLHGRPLLRSSVDAWSHWVFILHGICPVYLWQREDRLEGHAHFFTSIDARSFAALT